MDPILPPTFLVGAQRSGTTLFRLMLDHHPEIAFEAEFELVVERLPEVGWPDLGEYYDFLRTFRFVEQTYDIDRSLDYPSLARSFLEQKRRRGNKPRIGATVHLYFDRLLRIWPDARFIHIVRDGRDVARSCIAMGWAGNMFTGVERWIDAELLWKRMLPTLSPDRVFEVRYEDLVTDPEPVLKRVCNFIGAPFSPAMFDYVKTSTYEAPDKKLAYQWRNKLTRREVQLAETRIGEMLLERGYALSDHEQIDLSSAEQAMLRMHSRIATTGRRVKTYGPRLWAESFLARRVGFRRWKDSVQVRINAVDNTLIK